MNKTSQVFKYVNDTQHYFCERKERDYKGRLVFVITPKTYFDERGFLIDTCQYNPNVPDFQRIADSTFVYVGSHRNPEELLLCTGNFFWRDLLTEIKYSYARIRLLNIHKEEDHASLIVAAKTVDKE